MSKLWRKYPCSVMRRRRSLSLSSSSGESGELLAAFVEPEVTSGELLAAAPSVIVRCGHSSRQNDKSKAATVSVNSIAGSTGSTYGVLAAV